MSDKYLPSPSELDDLANLDPEIASLIAHLQPAKLPADPSTAIHAIRAHYDSLPLPPPHPDVTETNTTYTTRDGHTLRLLVFTPTSPSTSTTPRPIMLWLHGGGGCFGRPEGNATMNRLLALEHDLVVVSAQYRLAPEWPFPTGLHDAWDALGEVVKRAGEWDADVKAGLVVGGESAGAVMAAVVVLMAGREKGGLEGGVRVSGCYLAAGSYFNPYNVRPEEYRERYRSRFDERCMDVRLFPKEAKEAFDSCLKPDYASKEYRAALWDGHDLARLPRTYLQTCGYDINRDDGILYADLLRGEGVEAKLDVYAGAPHCFWAAFSKTALGKRWEGETIEAIRWVLCR